MKSKRSFFIALILLLGVAMTIGYAVLSQTLKINGNTGIAANSWIIYFDNLVERPGTMEATLPAKINAAKDRIDFSITLDKPGDNYTFETDIVNDGTIDAMIDSVSLSGIPASLNGIVEWKVNYLDGTELRKCDELLANTKRRIKVVVNYNKDIDALPEATDMELSLEVKYVQLDNTECSTTNPAGDDPIDPEDGRHTLTVDPNYGIYNGTDAPTRLRMAPGEVYVFGADPVQEVHTFTGWSVDEAEAYVESSKMITMDDEDINALANWDWTIVDEENDLGYCFDLNGTYYTKFTDVYDAITGDPTSAFSNGYVPLIDDVNIKVLHNGCDMIYPGLDNSLKIAEGQELNIDLNGKTTSMVKDFYNMGTLNLVDSSDRKSGTVNNNSYNRLITVNANSNTLIDGGTYNVNSLIEVYDDFDKIIVNNAIVNILPSSSNGVIAINVYNVGILEVTNTTIQGTMYEAIDSGNSNTTNIINNVNIDVVCSNGSCKGMWLGGDAESENVNIKLDLGNWGSAYGINSPNDSDKILKLKNYNIEIDSSLSTNTSSTLYGIYTHHTLTAENVNITIKDSDKNHKIYGIYNVGPTTCNECNLSVIGQRSKVDGGLYLHGGGTLENSTVDINLVNGSYLGVESGSDIVVNNLVFNGDITDNITDYSYMAQFFANVEINDSQFNGDVHGTSSVYGLLHNASSKTLAADNLDVSIKAGSAFGLDCYNANVTNLKIDLDVIENNANGYVQSQGLRFSGGLVDNAEITINSQPKSVIYGVYGSDGTLKNSSVIMDAPGSVEVYGVYGSDFNSIDNEFVMNVPESTAAKRIYRLSGDSTITGGTAALNGPVFSGSSEMDLYGIESMGTLAVSNFGLTSSYTCVNFNGTSLTTNSVTMTCGDYGIKNTNDGTIEKTDTTIDAGLE